MHLILLFLIVIVGLVIILFVLTRIFKGSSFFSLFPEGFGMPFKKTPKKLAPIWSESETTNISPGKEEIKKSFSENSNNPEEDNNGQINDNEKKEEKKEDNSTEKKEDINTLAKIKKPVLRKAKTNKSEGETDKEKQNITNPENKTKIDKNSKSGSSGYTFADIISKLEDQELKDILDYLRQKNYDFINRIHSNPNKLKNEKEAIELLKKEILAFFKDEYDNLKIKVSEKRKKGEDMTDISIRLMSLPLKIKMFESSFSKKDFYNVIKLIEDFETQL